MNSTVFSENLKKFRCEKNLTQEQVADNLRVNPQTVSRWECGTTLPDVMTLPVIAKLYGVTVDDFYKKHSVAYDNYAQRLSSVYEMTRDPEDFLRCRYEYGKLLKDGEPSIVDKWNYATIHHFMGRFCKDVALEWYDKAIADGYDADPHIYMRARSLRNSLLFEIGKGKDVIAEQKKKLSASQSDPKEWSIMCEAYIWDYDFESAYSVFGRAIEKFPDNWRLYIHGGAALEGMKRYDDALRCYDKAGEIGTDFYDDLYCKASCYLSMDEYEKAYDTYIKIADELRAGHYDVEADMAEAEAASAKAKTK